MKINRLIFTVLFVSSILLVSTQLPVELIKAAPLDGTCDNNELLDLESVSGDDSISGELSLDPDGFLYAHTDDIFYLGGEIEIYYPQMFGADCRTTDPISVQIQLYNTDTTDLEIVETVLTSTAATLTIDTRDYDDGPYEFRVYRADNDYYTASEVFIDNTPPEITDYPDLYLSAGSLGGFGATIEDNSGIFRSNGECWSSITSGHLPDLILDEVICNQFGTSILLEISLDGAINDIGGTPRVTGYKFNYTGNNSIIDLAGNQLAAGPHYVDESIFPRYVSAVNLDENLNGLIDGVEVTFTEDVFVSGISFAEFYDEDTEIEEDFSDDVEVDGRTMTFHFDSEQTPVSTQLYVNINDSYYQDASGNGGNWGGDLYTESFDFFAVTGAETYDVDEDGKIDSLKVLFSENIDDSTFDYNNLSFSDGYTLEELEFTYDCTEDYERVADSDYVCMLINEGVDYDTAATLDVTYDATEDPISNQSGSTQLDQLVEVTTADKAKPVFIGFTDLNYLNGYYARRVTLQFTEPVTASANYVKLGLNRATTVYSGNGTDTITFAVASNYAELAAVNPVSVVFTLANLVDLSGNISARPSFGLSTTTWKFFVMYSTGYFDSNVNGKVDTVGVIFNQVPDFDEYVFDPSEFIFSNHTVLGIADYMDWGDDKYVFFELEEAEGYETYLEESDFEYIADELNPIISSSYTLESFAVNAYDAASMYFINAYTEDSDHNGKIDQVIFNYSEEADDPALYDLDSPGIDFAPITITSATQATPGEVIYNLDESTVSFGTDFIPDFVFNEMYGYEDGNDLANDGDIVIEDSSDPIVTSYEAFEEDKVVITLSETLDELTISADNFSLYNVDTMEYFYGESFVLDGNELEVTFAEGSLTYENIGDTLVGFSQPEGDEMTDPSGNMLYGAGGGAYTTNSIPEEVADETAPIISEVTPIPAITSDSTPDYTFTTDEAGTIVMGGSCSTETALATVGENTITFDELLDGTYDDCTLKVVDEAENESGELLLAEFTIDTTAPVLIEVTPIDEEIYIDNANYVFSVNEINGYEYNLTSCSDAEYSADFESDMVETISFTGLEIDGVYECDLTAIDEAGNESNTLTVGPFTYLVEEEADETAPTISEVTPVATPTNDTTPSYVFSSDEAGTLELGGGCSTLGTEVEVGENVITMTELADGVYNCTLVVSDAAENDSNELTMAEFTIDATAPVLSEVASIDVEIHENAATYSFEVEEENSFEFNLTSCSDSSYETEFNQVATIIYSLSFANLELDGVYECDLTVTDIASNESNTLTIGPFTYSSLPDEEEPEEEPPVPTRRSTAAGSTRVVNPEPLTYEQEVEQVFEKGILTKEPTKEADKCEALLMMSRIFKWDLSESDGNDGFTDTPEWCDKAAQYAVTNGIIESKQILGVEKPLNRFEFVVMLYRILGENSVFDKAPYYDTIVTWAEKATNWAYAKKYMTGFADGSFGGDKPIIKQDLAIVVNRIVSDAQL